MSAIITHDLRLDTTEKFVDGLSTTNYYLGLGKPDAWPLDSSTSLEVPTVPVESDNASRGVWDNLIGVKKLSTTDITYAAVKNRWATGTAYTAYDDDHANIEGQIFYVTTDLYNVYICLRTGIDSSGVRTNSTVSPDVGVGTPVSGVVKTTDGYVWKYLYTISTATANSFLTTEFIPVAKLTSDDGSEQWDVQDNAVDGAIYRIKVVSGGSGYTSPTVTITGDGTSAAATAVVVSGVITEILLETAAPTSSSDYTNGSGYNYAEVTVAETGHSGTVAVLKAVMGPPGGFGKNARRDIRAHYAIINKGFNTSEETGGIPTSGEFRQISIINNPEASGTDITGNDYNACKSLSVSGSFTPGEVLVGSSSGAGGTVVEYDSTSGSEKVYYTQNEDDGYTQFTTSDTIGSGAHSITAVNASALDYDSGRVIFMENRDAVTRSSSQIETIRLVIEF
jgi:hypothetical protein